MRDITQDLIERITLNARQRETLQNQMEALLLQEKQLRFLLEQEMARWKTSQASLFSVATPNKKEEKSKISLGTELQRTLHERGSLTLTELKEALSDSPFLMTAKQPGKKINFTLVNLKRYGYVDFAEGKWSLLDKKAA